MKNKILRVTARTIAVILAIVLFLLFAVYFGEKLFFARFFLDADAEMKTPGLSDGYVPQGFDYVLEKSVFLTSGYMKDGSASRVYVISEESRKIMFFVELKNEDGSDHTGHTGGIAYYGNYVYIPNSDGCDIFLMSDLFDGDTKLTKCGEIKTGNDPAYCKVFDGKLYAGAFYYPEGGYHTPDDHQFTTPSGDKNSAIITVFELDKATGNVKSPTPVGVISTTDKVQGMTMTDKGNIILSTSWGLTISHLYEYNINIASTGEFDFNGTKVPLTYLDSKCLVRDIKAPPMAEEIIYMPDGEVYIMNESACTKYIFGNFTSGRRVYSYELD
jgi:hypothetical protein